MNLLEFKKTFYETTLFTKIEDNDFESIKSLLENEYYNFKDVTELHIFKSIECKDIRIFKLLMPFSKSWYYKHWVDRMVELERKDLILSNIHLITSEFPFYKFELDFQLIVMKKYLIHREYLLIKSCLQSSFIFENFLRKLIVSQKFSEDKIFLRKLKNLITWVTRTILKPTNTNSFFLNYKRIFNNPWTPFYRKLYPQYDEFSKNFYKFIDEDAAKKIYFWWIPICYDLNRQCGQRMALKNYQDYLNITF